MAKKRKRRRVHTAKFDRCVRKVKRRGSALSAYAVCTKELGRRAFLKRANPTWWVVTARRGRTRLRFGGYGAQQGFSDKRRPAKYPSPAAAAEKMDELRRRFGRVLSGWKLGIARYV